MSGRSGVPENELASLHERLHTHFTALSERRAGSGDQIPTFALEHGLSESDLSSLKRHICLAVQQRQPLGETWLPLVVYATELGYEYSGDEYWQTFEAQTPGWVGFADRQYIRTRFTEFKDTFRGARPSGPWAKQFSIICWPITHAVLPTDLQRHLARLLFDNRRVLTSDLLADPDEFGTRLAARAWQASARFKYFAQNTSLLGRVASALLVDDHDEQSPYLLDSTLARIVADLSEEREARHWLQGAQSTAAHVRTRGFRPTGGRGGEHDTSGPAGLLAPAADPELSLRWEGGGWTAYAELPNLSVLAERFPEVGEELRDRRATVAGASGGPLARRRLLFAGQRLRLSEWPRPESPLLQVEGGTSTTNSILADQSVISPGPLWLFKVRRPGLATEVRGKFVRPGHRYVLLSEEALSARLPEWIVSVPCSTAGVHAYAIDVPTVVDAGQLEGVRTIGLASVSDVEILPAGFVPALWDGEGRAEWLAGERPILGVASTRSLVQAVWEVDSESRVITWPVDEDRMFVRFDELSVGTHGVEVSLFDKNQDEPIAHGQFEIQIRATHARPTSGTFREGLVVLSTPVNPTLTELWDGHAVVEIRGPDGVEVSVEAVLTDRSHVVLARRKHRAALPVDHEDWTHLFDDLLRGRNDVQRVYDDSERCVLSVSHERLGVVSLSCEREFAPLRWAAGSDRDGPLVRLIDNTERADIELQLFEFAHPDRARSLELDARSCVRWKRGGLVTAEGGAATAAMILPPRVQQLGDLYLAPQLSSRAKSVSAVVELLNLARLWAGASLPSDPFGQRARVKVLRSITGHLAGLIGGERWAALETRVAAYDADVDTDDLLAGIGDQQYQQALAAEIGRWVDAIRPAQPHERAQLFAEALATHARIAGIQQHEDPRLAEFLLRLASETASLVRWPSDDLRAGLALALHAPALLRAARSMVLAIDALEVPSVSATFGGWAWQ